MTRHDGEGRMAGVELGDLGERGAQRRRKWNCPSDLLPIDRSTARFKGVPEIFGFQRLIGSVIR